MAYSKSEKTRQTLIETTAKLMRAKGYAAMGLQDIVKTSGIPKGSLYHHFAGGKEELAAESIHHSGKKMITSLTLLAQNTGGPVEGVRAFCDYYIGQLEQSGYRNGCPLATVALETAADAPMVQKACASAFQNLSALLSDFLVEKGVPTKKAEETGLLSLTLLEGALLLSKAKNDTYPLALARDRLTEQLQTLINS